MLIGTPLVICTALLLFIPLRAYGQPDGDLAWEPEDLTLFVPDTSSYRSPSTGGSIAFKLIEFYQSKISAQSVSRCPFYISCSNYARQAIAKYGLIVGISVFIDRNFYREHVACYRYYELRETSLGTLKLDDSYYLE